MPRSNPVGPATFLRARDELLHDSDGSTHPVPAGPEGLCWRPWPCERCRRGSTPIGIVIGSGSTGKGVRPDDQDAIAELQVRSLVQWVESCPHGGAVLKTLPKISTGSEHAVYFEESSNLVFKKTLPGTFGDHYFLDDSNRVNQEKASPLEYLIRMRLWSAIFGNAPEPVGVIDSGAIVSRQAYIKGNIPSQDSVNQFIEDSGFSGVKIQCFIWKRAFAKFEIWVGDARDENFVETKTGIVPIDLRIWTRDVKE